MQQDSDKNSVIIGIVAIVIIGLLVGGTILFKPKVDATQLSLSDSSRSATTTDTNSSSSTVADPSATYKDGTFTTNTPYSSPGGTEVIAVSITISGNKVTNSSVQTVRASNESQGYQDDFISSYKQFVVGKAIASLQVGRVSGASLTSRGFNEALNTIRTQAKA